jgi:hypothetical protein
MVLAIAPGAATHCRPARLPQALRDFGLPQALNPRSKRVTVSLIRRQILEEKECDADHTKGSIADRPRMKFCGMIRVPRGTMS